jgi:hypothetical protein
MKRIILLVSLSIIFLFSCKKAEERDLIKEYVGTYSVTHIKTTLENLQLVNTEEQIELSVKRSCKGIKIKGVQGIDNFDVNYKDSTFSEIREKDEVSAYGKFLPNNSISLTISYSAKLPFADHYSMKKK